MTWRLFFFFRNCCKLVAKWVEIPVFWLNRWCFRGQGLSHAGLQRGYGGKLWGWQRRGGCFAQFVPTKGWEIKRNVVSLGGNHLAKSHSRSRR